MRVCQTLVRSYRAREPQCKKRPECGESILDFYFFSFFFSSRHIRNWHFVDGISGIQYFCGEFRTKFKSRASKRDGIEDGSGKHFIACCFIGQRCAKQNICPPRDHFSPYMKDIRRICFVFTERSRSKNDGVLFFFHGRKEEKKIMRLIFKIRILDHKEIPGRFFQPCPDCRPFALIVFMKKHYVSWHNMLLEEFCGAVCGTVIHDNNFFAHIFEINRFNPFEKGKDRVPFVVYRYNNGECWHTIMAQLLKIRTTPAIMRAVPRRRKMLSGSLRKSMDISTIA